MTAIATVFTENGIVMAADSRMTMGTEDNPGDHVLVQKLFVIKKTNTGIAARGDGLKNGIPLRKALVEFVSTLNQNSKNHLEMALLLRDFMKRHYPEFQTTFYLCGYDGTTPAGYIMDFDNDLEPQRLNVKGNLLINDVHGEGFGVEGNDYLKNLQPKPNFYSPKAAISLLDGLYKFRIKVLNEKYSKGEIKNVDVGEPIDYIIIKPNSIRLMVKSEDETYLD